MLILRVDFLAGTYLAAEPTAPAYPEWPPAPDRVFQAMVSAAAAVGQDLSVLRALEGAPEVAFGHARPVFGATVYVPAAYLQTPRGEPASRQNNAKYAPMMVGIDAPVYFAWKDTSDALAEALRPVVAALHYLGRAKCPVMVSIAHHLPDMPRHLVPSPLGEELLRVPGPGRLDELDAAFVVKARAPVAGTVPYAEKGTEVFQGPWHDLLALRTFSEVPMRRTAELASALRTAVLSKAGDDAPAVLHGHVEDHHVAWSVLPDVGHRHARGRVLGVGAWLPRLMTNDDRAAAAIALSALEVVLVDSRPIAVGRSESTRATPIGLGRRPWCAASRRWASVTPVVFDRHPKAGQRPETLIADAVQRAGYPRPVEVALSQESPHRGVPRAHEFRPRRPGRWTHALLEFDLFVSGPVLVGRERYFGMGMMRPVW